ncbi:MAG: hypothetical protein AAF367_16705 [Pseudomonadota bacterium]
MESSQRLIKQGFSHVVAAGRGITAFGDNPPENVITLSAAVHDPAARAALLNRLIEGHAGQWLMVSFNGDFMFHPFCETRGVKDLIEFLWSERRASAMAYSIDLYSDDMIGAGVPNPDDSWFDRRGWYGFDRGNGLIDVYGGLGWRYEEYAPLSVSRINRPALFRASAGVRIRDDLWFEDDSLNTVACPWHNNPSIALMSFRRTRLVLEHPNFRSAISSLQWPNSERFEWRSGQLISHGLIEAGQWI